MFAYLSALWMGDANALRSALLYGAVGGGVIVAIGIIWESKKLDVATVIVVVGVVIEAACTIKLFVVDEDISREQQTRIEQMLAHRHLSVQQKERLAAVTKKFPSLNFLTITSLDAESWDFVMEIAAELKHDGWNWIPCDGPSSKLPPMDGRPPSCVSVLDHIQVDGSKDKAEIVFSLVNALRDPAVIGMEDARPEISEAFPTIAIMAGAKR